MQAPLPVQLDLEDAIKQSEEQGAQRSKFLQASANAQAAHAEKAKNGALKTTSYLAELQKDFSVAKAKEKHRLQRKNAKVDNVGPTPERLRKAIDDDGMPAVTVGTQVKSHTLTSPVDKYGPRWPVEIEQAARTLRDLFLLAASEKPITANYNGNGGGAYGPRDGGVPDHVREARATVDLIRARFPSCVPDIEAFIVQIVTHSDGATLKFEDTGTAISPWKTPDARKGAGYGAFYRTLTVLEWFLAERSGGTIYRPEAAASLEKAIRAGAQVIREREEKVRQKRERANLIRG